MEEYTIAKQVNTQTDRHSIAHAPAHHHHHHPCITSHTLTLSLSCLNA